MDNKNAKRKTGYALIPRGVMIAFCYVIPAMLIAALIVTGIWGNTNRVRAEALRRTNEGIYRQAYTELADSVYSMQTALSKLTVCEAPSTLTETLDDVRRESGTIAALMGRIPQSHAENVELNRFLIRVGDYARSLGDALRSGGSLSAEDRGQLMEVCTACEAVFGELANNLGEGCIPLEALDSNGFFSVKGAVGGTNGSGTNGGGTNGAGGDSASDAASPRYPSIVYDGPFSESTEKRQPRGLSGEESDSELALANARRHLGDEAAELDYGGISYGRIPFHGFSGTLSDGRRAEIAMSVRGAALLYMRMEETGAANGTANGTDTGADAASGEGESGSGIPGEEELSRLGEAGRAWLAQMGYPEMEATEVQYYENSVIISYAAVERCTFKLKDGGIYGLFDESSDMSELINAARRGENGTLKSRVILYNDLVRLRIERGSARVIGADAQNYLFSHAERTLPDAIISREQAAERLSPNLEVEKTALALLPMADGSERLCYEFTGSFAGADFAVYLDAETGGEVRILRRISDENGTCAL